MKLLRLAAALTLLVPAMLAAQLRPQPGSGDPRLQTIVYDAEQVVQLQAALGYQVTVELGSDEHIENVAVGDSGAWQVSANRRGDHLFIKAVEAGVATNMTVVTSVRLYTFELMPFFGSVEEMAYTVRFLYAAPAEAEQEPSAGSEGHYRLTGKQSLRPSTIRDDGQKTYLQWPRDSALPAVYAVDAAGQEVLVNGNMRNDVFVIDSIVPHLVFRIDRSVAQAVRFATGEVR